MMFSKINSLVFVVFVISSVCCHSVNVRNVRSTASNNPVESFNSASPAVDLTSANSAFTFSDSPSRSLAAVETRYVNPESYFQNGQIQHIHASFPISLDTQMVYDGLIKVTLNAINVHHYEISYNHVDGFVKHARLVSQTQYTGSVDQMAIASKIMNIIANCQRISFEHDGSIKFTTDNGTSGIMFDRHVRAATLTPPSGASHIYPAVETRYIVPETYFQNGRFQSLYNGPPFPITVTSERQYGTSLTVTLKAVNSVTYELMYNNADGWVSNVKQLGETRMHGTPQQMEAETKIKNIIANCQQIAFEKDGRIQFITDNGSTRISFDPARHRNLAAYSQPTPSSVSHTHYAPQYTNQWTSAADRTFAASQSNAHWTPTTDHIHPTNYGYSNPNSFGNSFGVETRRILPETYFQNGRFQSLYNGPPFPITITSERRYGTSLTVTLKGFNSVTYELMYNNADGWVSNVKQLGETRMHGTPQQMEAETKIKNIIANCQQIAFEKDGRIQFITDNGSTRITFVL